MHYTEFAVISEILKAVGVILIAIMALGTHLHVATDRPMNDQVFKSMRRQRRFALAGVALVAVGFLLEIYTHIKF